jgi:hypothetical protein
VNHSILVRPDKPGHVHEIITICPKCHAKKHRSVLTATSEQAQSGRVTCPVHGVMSVAELHQVNA